MKPFFFSVYFFIVIPNYLSFIRWFHSKWRYPAKSRGIEGWASPTACRLTFSHSLQWSHNKRDGVSDHRGFDCLLSRLFWCRSNKTSKLFEGNPSVTGGFPSQMVSNAENASLRWRHHGLFAWIIWVHLYLWSIKVLTNERKRHV